MACDYVSLHLEGRNAPWRDVAQVCNEQRPPAALWGRNDLAGTKLGLDEDLTPAQQAHKSELWPLFKEAKAAGKHAFWRAVKFFINGTRICPPSSI
jgi:hypothetical protein